MRCYLPAGEKLTSMMRECRRRHGETRKQASLPIVLCQMSTSLLFARSTCVTSTPLAAGSLLGYNSLQLPEICHFVIVGGVPGHTNTLPWEQTVGQDRLQPRDSASVYCACRSQSWKQVSWVASKKVRGIFLRTFIKRLETITALPFAPHCLQ